MLVQGSKNLADDNHHRHLPPHIANSTSNTVSMRKVNSKMAPGKQPNNAIITENAGDCHLTRYGVTMSAVKHG